MTKKPTAYFNGCSFTHGQGFLTPEQKDLYVYDRLVATHFAYNRINISEPGSSNHRIFIRSLDALEKDDCDILFVQWSALNRIWLSPGPETWYSASPNSGIKEYIYRNRTLLEGKKKLEFETTLAMFNHDYHNILELIDYCNVLEKIAKQSNITVIYINGLVPWQRDLVQPLTDNLHHSLNYYTKKILDFDTRDDTEIVTFFSKLQKKFSTLNLNLWVNVFDSQFHNMIDQGPAGHHPGIKSNQWIANKIIDFIESKGL